MTALQIIAAGIIAVWLTAGIIALPIALAFMNCGARADDRTRNNAAGEKGEGEKVRFNHGKAR